MTKSALLVATVITCCSGPTETGLCQTLPGLMEEVGSSQVNFASGPAFSFRTDPVRPAYDLSTTAIPTSLDCSGEDPRSLPQCSGTFPSIPQQNGAAANGSPSPVVVQNGKVRHHPHLIELTSQNWRPLKPGEKFELVWRDMISWETHLSLAIDGAISFATDDRDYLGEGFQGWGRRYGINVVDEANFTLMQAYIFPTLFHMEPRYIPMNTGATRRRFCYAVTRVVVARKDSGGYAFNAAKILGALSAAAISNAYNSPANREPSFGETFTRAGISVGSDAAFNIFKEFWPDFARKVKLNVWIQNIVRSSIRDVIQVD